MEAKIHVLADESMGGIKREYVEVERKAEVGERVIIVKVDDLNNEGYRIGDIFEVYSTWENGRNDKCGIDTKCGISLFDEEYLVLEPVESEQTSPQTTDDIIANLVGRMAELERREEAQRRLNGVLSQRINATHRDIETWAQETEELKFKVRIIDDYQDVNIDRLNDIEDKIEMCIDDIAFLDERTQPKEITISVADLSKLIGGVKSE